MRLLKTDSHTSDGLAVEPGKREEKQLKETPTLQQGKPPIRNLTRTAGGGEAEKALREQYTEKALQQGKALSKGRGTQAPIQGRSHAKNLPRTIGMAGVR